jgi:hypothetical protein
MRSPSDNWALPPLSTESTLTIDSDRAFSQVVLAAVATVETMPFAGYDEDGAATSSSNMSLGSGLEVNTPRPP